MRLVLAGMALIAATYGLARFGYGLFLPLLRDEFGLEPGLAGLVQAGSFLSYCCAAAAAALVVRGPRTGVVLAGATAALGAAGIALAPSAAVLAASVVVAGAGAGFATPAVVALIQRGLPPEREERAQTTANAGTGAGIVVAALLLVSAGEQWRLAWGAIALLSAVATVAVLGVSRRRARGPRAARQPEAAASGPAPAASASAGGVGIRPLAAPLAAALLAGASSAAVWTFGGSVLDEAAPLGTASSVVAWAVLGAFGAAGAWAGRVVQRSGLRLGWTATTLTMVVATLVLGLAPASPVAALAAAAAFGASYTALSGVLIVWAVRLDGERAARGTVVLFIALALGQAAGAAGIGAIVELLSPAAGFAVAGAIGLLATAPALRAPAPAAAGPRSRPPRS